MGPVEGAHSWFGLWSLIYYLFILTSTYAAQSWPCSCRRAPSSSTGFIQSQASVCWTVLRVGCTYIHTVNICKLHASPMSSACSALILFVDKTRREQAKIVWLQVQTSFFAWTDKWMMTGWGEIWCVPCPLPYLSVLVTLSLQLLLTQRSILLLVDKQ